MSKYDLKAHPAADLFPLMGDDELLTLAHDIEQNGQNHPITLVGDLVLDGRNRLRACELIGLEPKFEQLREGRSPVAFVISENLRRRNLDESQRALLGARAQSMFEEDAAKRKAATQFKQNASKAVSGGNSLPVPANLPEPQEGGESREKAAELVNVSARSVQHASKVLEQGVLELVQAVEAGTVKVSVASVLAGAPKEEQLAVLARGKKGVREEVAKMRKVKKGKGVKGEKREAKTPDEKIAPNHEGEVRVYVRDGRQNMHQTMKSFQAVLRSGKYVASRADIRRAMA